MTVKLNHTIVHAHDKRASADFFSQVFGLGAPVAFGPFLDVETANEVTLAFLETDDEIQTQHYAFLVSEDEFDAIFARVKDRGLTWWADPMRSQPGRINTRDGGRGCYFEDPAGNLLEIITRPYGA
ncbi:MAG TPA: VOC family protein [Burkholderiales bacterium]|nr:VOC family protein [Burkholderiales bacterium]